MCKSIYPLLFVILTIYLVPAPAAGSCVNPAICANPRFVSLFTTPQAFGVAVSGNYAYVADYGCCLKIINIANPSSPTLAGSLGVPSPQDIAVSGNYAYVVGNQGLYIINIANPTNPYLVNYYSSSNARGVAVSGNYAYMVGSGLKIFDISNLPSLTFLGEYQPFGYDNYYGVAVSGNYAYTTSETKGLQIINIANPSSPTLTGQYKPPTDVYFLNVAVSGNYAYVAGNQGLQIFNIATPYSPTLAGSYSSNAKDIAVSGNYAYVAGNQGLQIFNIATPSSPTLTGSITIGDASYVAVSGNYAYVTNFISGGLYIIDTALTCTDSDPTNCGSCGNSCDDDNVCTQDTCSLVGSCVGPWCCVYESGYQNGNCGDVIGPYGVDACQRTSWSSYNFTLSSIPAYGNIKIRILTNSDTTIRFNGYVVGTITGGSGVYFIPSPYTFPTSYYTTVPNKNQMQVSSHSSFYIDYFQIGCGPSPVCSHTPINNTYGSDGTTFCCNGAATDITTTTNCGTCGNQCSTSSYCSGSTWYSACTATCTGGACGKSCTPQNCDDSNPCTTDTCDSTNGCVHTPISCDDSNPCTTDTCDPATGCVHTSISCDDSNACTFDGTCDPSTGCPAKTLVSCDDSNSCTTDTCNPSTGCQHTNLPNNQGGDDTHTCCGGTLTLNNTITTCGTCGNICTDTASYCSGSTWYSACTATCTGGVCGKSCTTQTNCDDNDPSTTDTCDPTTGCVHTPTCSAGLTYCSGACKNLASDPLHCGSCSNQCSTSSYCSGSTWYSSCTPTCTGGTCGKSCTPQNCDDSNACTVDGTCNPSTGCPAKTNLPNNQGGDDTHTCCGGTLTLNNTITDCGSCSTTCQTGYACVGGTCKTSCSSVNDCASGYFCVDTECKTGCQTGDTGKSFKDGSGLDKKCCGTTTVLTTSFCTPSTCSAVQGWCNPATCTWNPTQYCANCASDPGYSTLCATYCSTPGTCRLTLPLSYCNSTNEWNTNTTSGSPYCINCLHCGDSVKNCGEQCESSTFQTDCNSPPTSICSIAYKNITNYTTTACTTCGCVYTPTVTTCGAGCSDITNPYCTFCGTNHCSDSVQNCGEGGVNCGGGCAPCTVGNGQPCTVNSNCTSSFCVSNITHTSKFCCPPNNCYNGTSCVTNQTLGQGQNKMCNDGSWTSCSSCSFINPYSCANTPTGWKWTLPVSFEGNCYGCNRACTNGICCPSSNKCGYTENSDCTGNTQCCSGNCDSGKCCPTGKVWCLSSCLSIVTNLATGTCTCDGQCPSGYVCLGGKCQPSIACSQAMPCPTGLTCVRQPSDNALSHCCSSGSCWNDTQCVGSGYALPDGSKYCSQGSWYNGCSQGKIVYGPFAGNCSSTCGAPSSCNNHPPGSDYQGYACNSTCQNITQTVNLTTKLIKCSSFSQAQCLDEPGVNGTLSMKEGALAFLTYSVSMPGFQNATFRIFLDNALVHNETKTSGFINLEQAPPGNHVLRVSASHPDFLDQQSSYNLVIIPDLRSLIILKIEPSSISLTPHEKANLSLIVNSSMDKEINFTTQYPVFVTLRSSITLAPYDELTLPVNLTAPTQPGAYPINITLSSSSGNLTAAATLTVFENNIYSASVTPIFENDTLSIRVLNNGTLADSYNLTTCLNTTNFTLNPGASKTVKVGEIQDECLITLASPNIEQNLTITPISLQVNLPELVQAQLGQPTRFNFSTDASEPGIIQVTPDLWISPFTCNSTCSKQLNFTPDGVGNFTINFDISWPEFRLESSASLKVEVIRNQNVSVDLTAIEQKLSNLESEIKVLDRRGIDVSGAKTIIGEAKKLSPETPEDVTNVLTMLKQAEDYIKYAKSTRPPKPPEFPIGSFLIGLVSIIIGAGVLVFVFQHEKHPAFQPAGRPSQEELLSLEPQKYFKGTEIPRIKEK